MRYTTIIIFCLLFLAACTIPEIIPEEEDSPSDEILDMMFELESEFFNGNFEPYIEHTYFSPYFMDNIFDESYMLVEGNTSDVFIGMLKSQWQGMMDAGMINLSVKSINLTEERWISDEVINLRYSIFLTTPEGDIIERRDSSFFRQMDGKWFLDAEAEYIANGNIVAPRKEPPKAPEGILDCGITDEDMGYTDCFIEAKEDCTEAKMIVGSIEEPYVTRWIDKDCKIHEYMEDYDQQYYSICEKIVNFDSMSMMSNPYKSCRAVKGWVSPFDMIQGTLDQMHFLTQFYNYVYGEDAMSGMIPFMF